MELKKYLAEERGRATWLAKTLRVTPTTVHEWANIKVPADRAPSIERETAGAVRCEEMRPDVDWSVLRNSDCPQQEAA